MRSEDTLSSLTDYLVLLQIRDGFTAQIPLVATALTLVHHVAFDRGAAVVLRSFPGQEDGLAALIAPLQVLGRIGYSLGEKKTT